MKKTTVFCRGVGLAPRTGARRAAVEYAAFIARRLKPGGCPDLLAVTDLRRYGAWLFRSINQAMPR